MTVYIITEPSADNILILTFNYKNIDSFLDLSVIVQ